MAKNGLFGGVPDPTVFEPHSPTFGTPTQRGGPEPSAGLCARVQDQITPGLFPLDLQIRNPWELVSDTRIYIFNNLLLT